MKYIFTTLVGYLFISCGFTDAPETDTYFGGQIIKKKKKFVLLLKDDTIIDTLYLNSENKFISNYKNISEGLYTFKHGIEFQYVYLEPNDSVLVRLNTWDFDESVVFSGKGSNKNEFLINLFLKSEKEEKQLFHYFKLNENDFNSKLDSLAKERLQLLDEFEASEGTISDNFEKLTKAAINFPLYRLKEIYPYFFRKAHNLKEFPVLSDHFYDFRKEIDLNKEDYISFYPYQNYVVSYLYNLTYQKEDSEISKNNLTIYLLKTIIENIHSEEFKNTLLKRVVVNDFLFFLSSYTIHQPTLNLFLENCTNKTYLKQVNQLVEDSKKVENNKALINFEIQSSDQNLYSINEIIKNKNTAIYFWTTEFMSSEYLVKRIKYLKNQYPTIQFIGINMQSSFHEIRSEPYLKKFDILQQFRLTKTSEAHSFLTSQYPRVILVNRKGIVKNGFTFLDSNKLHSELAKLQIN